MTRETKNKLNEWQSAVAKVSQVPDGILLTEFASINGIDNRDQAWTEMRRLIRAGLAKRVGIYRGKARYALTH